MTPEDHAYIDMAISGMRRELEQHIIAVTRELTEIQRQITETHDSFLRFVPMDAYETRHSSLENRIGKLEQFQANTLGRLIAVGFVGAIFVAITSALITHLVTS
jgi:hypothetical protein